MDSRGISGSRPGSVHGVRAGPERLRAVLTVDVSFARVPPRRASEALQDDDDAVPARRGLSDAEALRLAAVRTIC